MSNNPKIEIIQDGKVVDEVFLGIAIAGEAKLTIVDVKNVGDVNLYDVEIKSDHSDVEVHYDKKELQKDSLIHVSLSYTPKSQLDAGVNSKINVNAKYVV